MEAQIKKLLDFIKTNNVKVTYFSYDTDEVFIDEANTNEFYEIIHNIEKTLNNTQGVK